MNRRNVHQDLEPFLEQDREDEIPGLEKFTEEDREFLDEFRDLMEEFQ